MCMCEPGRYKASLREIEEPRYGGVVCQIAERGKEIFHPLDNAVHVIFLEVKLWKL